MTLLDLTDAQKVEFLLAELQDAATTLRHYTASARYQAVVDEMRGDTPKDTDD